MPRNVEIKAKVDNLEGLKEKAQSLSGNMGTFIEQEDTFFNALNGRLKLRTVKGKESVLIHYDRPDQDGPKLSNFTLSVVNDPENLKSILTKALGVKGVVSKSRLLVMLGQTRIHLDDVHGLGHFMELEVILTDDQTVGEGEEIAQNIMGKLDINRDSLINCAYMDMILKGK